MTYKIVNIINSEVYYNCIFNDNVGNNNFFNIGTDK